MSRLQDRLARCSNSFYPVLVTNFTSWADPVRQENPRQTRGPPTSGEYINFFNPVKYIQIIFSGILYSLLVDFASLCGKTAPTAPAPISDGEKQLGHESQTCGSCSSDAYAVRAIEPSLQMAATISPSKIS